MAPKAVFFAACALALENLPLCGLYGFYVLSPQTKAKLFSAQYPFVWVLVLTVLAGLIACGRALQPA